MKKLEHGPIHERNEVQGKEKVEMVKFVEINSPESLQIYDILHDS